MDLDQIQAALREKELDGWLFYDHHGRDPLAYRILGLDVNSHVTRRWFYFIPSSGEPKKLTHRIESGRLDVLPGANVSYSSWQELEAGVEAMLYGHMKLAMQYSPRNALMSISLVDAGTVEMLRAIGKEVVSSADLVSLFEALLTGTQMTTHDIARTRIDRILHAAWTEMGQRVRSAQGTNEFAMVEYLRESLRREDLLWEHGPNVSCGPNSADSHYEPAPQSSRPIMRGDFILIDIWGRLDQPGSVWYDITWTGVIDREPTEREQLIFNTVRHARDAAITLVQEAFATNTLLAGWQADDAAREVIRQAGFANWFTHRTGHNIATDLHGNGAHLDNLETHDERVLLPNTCFSVEPGLYFPGEFGVRSEINMMTRPGRADVTGRLQHELIRI